jgi:hypothetical protein
MKVVTKTELNPKKISKAEEGLQTLQPFRDYFKELKLQSDETTVSNNPAELLGRRSHHTSTPDNPYSNAAIGGCTHLLWILLACTVFFPVILLGQGYG